MREIKFRGKRVDNGEWVYGYYYSECGNHYIFEDRQPETMSNRNLLYSVVPETVGQFTGLKDKNGVDIFEGDILEHIVNNHPKQMGKTFRNTVEYYNGRICGWRLRNKSFHMKLTENWIFNQEPKVIGNIHDK